MTLGLCIAAAASIAACGSSSGGGSSSNTSAGSGSSASSPAVAAATKALAAAEKTPTAITQTLPLKSAPPKGKKVVYIVISGNPANAQSGAAIQQAAEAAGWTYKEIDYNSADLASLQAAFSEALQMGANYVELSGASVSSISTSTVAAYKKAGAQIIVSGTTPNEVNSVVNATPIGAATRVHAAQILADWFVSNSDGKGKAVFSTLPMYPILDEVTTSFTADVKRMCPGCSVSLVKFSASDLASSSVIPTLVSTLRANPSDTYLLFDWAGYNQGIDAALKTAGLTKVQVGGVGMEPWSAEGLESGAEKAWVAYGWGYTGYAQADATFRLATDSPGISGDTTMPTQLITKANVGDWGGQDYTKPDDAFEQFKKLWHLS